MRLAFDDVYKPSSKWQFDILLLQDIRANQKAETQRRIPKIYAAEDISRLPHDAIGGSLHFQNTIEEQRQPEVIAISTDIPQARIAVWEYSVKPGAESPKRQIKTYAKRLLKALEDHLGQNPRPFTFIAHGIGTLIVKELLCAGGFALNEIRGIILIDAQWYRLSSGKRQSAVGLQSAEERIKASDFSAYAHRLDVLFKDCLEAKYNDLKTYDLPESAFGQDVLSYGMPSDGTVRGGRNLRYTDDVEDYTSGYDLDRLVSLSGSFDAYDQHTTIFSSIARHHNKVMNALKQTIPPAKNAIRTSMSDSIEQNDTIEQNDPMISSTTDLMQQQFESREHDTRNEKCKTLDQNRLSAEAKLLREALLAHDRGDYGNAKERYEQAITKLQSATNFEGLREILLFCKDKLTGVLYALARFDEADKLCIAIEAVKNQFPEDSRSMLRTARNRAMLHRVHSNLDEAYLGLASKLEEATDLEPYKYDWILTIDLLAAILKDRGEFPLAEFLQREAIEAWSAHFGEKSHQFILTRLSALSTLFWLRGQRRRAEEASLFAYRALKSELGLDHASVLQAAKRYSNYLRYQGRLHDAHSVLRDILPRTVRTHGENHPVTLWTKCSIAATYILQGYIEQGGSMLREILKLQEEYAPNLQHDRRWSSKVIDHLEVFKVAGNGRYKYLVSPSQLHEELKALLQGPRISSESVNPKAFTSITVRHSRTYTWGAIALPDSANPAIKCRSIAFSGVRPSRIKYDRYEWSGGYFGTLLHAAAFGGNVELVKELLEDNHEHMEHRRGIFDTPIKAAVVGGHKEAPEIVKLMLKTFEETSASRQACMTNLEAAILFEEHEIVGMLLDYHKSLTTFDCGSLLFGDAFCQAVPIGNSKIMHLLLNAVVSRKNGLFSLSPIQEAGLAAGDAAVLDASQASTYVLQRHEDLKHKQVETLRVVDMLIIELEESKDTSNKTDLIMEAVGLVAYPSAPPPMLPFNDKVFSFGSENIKTHTRSTSTDFPSQKFGTQDSSLDVPKALFKSGSYPGHGPFEPNG